MPEPELGNEGKDHFEILANSLERQRVSAVAGGKLELPGQGVPKLELGNEGKSPKSAVENLEVILPALPHALAKIQGDPSECGAPID